MGRECETFHVGHLQNEILLSRIGRSDRAALDYLTREFHRRGWSDDDDAAGAIVDALTSRGGHASRRTVLAAVPRDFLERNSLTRADIARTLDRVFGA